MENIADTIRLAVLHVFGWLLPTTLLVWIYLVLDSHGLNPFKSMKRFIALIPPVGRVVFCALLAGFIVYGSTKSGGDTNSPPSRMSSPRRTPRLADVVAPEDIARGWRVVTSAEVESIAEMPAGAVTNDLLRRRGGFDWAFRVEPEGWRFPYRDGALDGVTVFARGEVRPDVGTLYFPVPLTNGVSLLPEARWGLLDHAEPQSRREVSVFSHAVTTNGSLLLGWRNALVGRDVNSPTNLQMELFSDGSFAWRTDGVSTSYLPVFPFDYDGDGLENSVDPEPLVANSIDVHGTTAEWYRVVCSNVFEVTETEIPPVDNDSTSTGTTGILPVEGGSVQFKTNVNSRAYYFVDVVASSGPAPIYFNADRDSRLGSPVVVACPGETNHVPLLIGVEYTVTSTVPISVSAPDAMYAVVTSNDARSVTVKWPLEFEFVENLTAQGRSYTVNVIPYDPGGDFVWDTPSQRLAPRLLMVGGGACGCVSASGNTIVFGCSETCDCQGACMAHGAFAFENALFSVTGGVCRCGFDDPPCVEEPYHESTEGPSFSITANKTAVIFEDAYQDSPGVWREHGSTRVRLTVSAYGGTSGGSFTLATANLDRLSAVACGPMQFPPSMTLAPGESYFATFVCKGVAASESENDVSLSGSFVPEGGGTPISDSVGLTVVKVYFLAHDVAPGNSCPSRHRYGIGECVDCGFLPALPQIGLTIVGGSEMENVVEGRFIKWSLFDETHSAQVNMGTVSYSPRLEVVCPQGIETREIGWITNGLPSGTAGGVRLVQKYYVYPFDVSFRNLAVEEVPVHVSEAIEPTGYFLCHVSDDRRTHTRRAGAGRWMDVDGDNCVGGGSYVDDAGFNGVMPRRMPDGTVTTNTSYGWLDGGTLIWAVPFGWNRRNLGEFETPLEVFATDSRQMMTISTSGDCRVEKLGSSVERRINCDIIFRPRK